MFHQLNNSFVRGIISSWLISVAIGAVVIWPLTYTALVHFLAPIILLLGALVLCFIVGSFIRKLNFLIWEKIDVRP